MPTLRSVRYAMKSWQDEIRTSQTHTEMRAALFANATFSVDELSGGTQQAAKDALHGDARGGEAQGRELGIGRT